MKRIKAILDDHGIEWKMKGGKLYVLNCFGKVKRYIRGNGKIFPGMDSLSTK